MTEPVMLITRLVAAEPLPPADDRIYGPHAFGPGWLIAGIGALVVGIAALVWMLRRKRPAVLAAKPQEMVDLCTKYLRRLEELEQQLADERLTPRALHHELSRTLRRLAHDTGTLAAPAMSATGLDAAGHRPVADAVRSYVHPQFDALPNGDPAASLIRARQAVVETAAGYEAGRRVPT